MLNLSEYYSSIDPAILESPGQSNAITSEESSIASCALIDQQQLHYDESIAGIALASIPDDDEDEDDNDEDDLDELDDDDDEEDGDFYLDDDEDDDAYDDDDDDDDDEDEVDDNSFDINIDDD